MSQITKKSLITTLACPRQLKQEMKDKTLVLMYSLEITISQSNLKLQRGMREKL